MNRRLRISITDCSGQLIHAETVRVDLKSISSNTANQAYTVHIQIVEDLAQVDLPPFVA